MRYRKRLTAVLALAVAGGVVFAATALAANVQTFDAKTTATDGAFGTAFEKAKIKVTVSTEDDAGATVPDPVTRARISFDKQIKVSPGAVPTCDRTLIEGDTTAQAKTDCPGKRIVGGGSAIARTAGGTNLPATVTAFNGQPEGADPADSTGKILLHTYIPAAGTSVVLQGYLRDGSASGTACGSICNGRYGRMLDVTVPGLPGVTLVQFTTTVAKAGFVKGKCTAGDGLMKYASLWNYQSNPDIVVKDQHAC